MDTSILSLETSINEKDENSADGTDRLMDLSLPPTVIQQNNSNHKDEHEEKSKVLESTDQPTTCSEEHPLLRTTSSEAVLSCNVAQTISEKIEKYREPQEKEDPQAVDLHKKIQETDPSTIKEVVEGDEVSRDPGNETPSVETTDNSFPLQLNVESSVNISENKSTSSSPAPSTGTTTTTTTSFEKQLKSEKLEQPPLVPPVVLSLTPRSRSSSHSSKSSKPASPIPAPSPRPKQKIKRPPNKDVAAIYDGVNDFYCWQCHKDGQVLCCELCPRVFHTKCLNMKKPPEGDWYCPICEKITKAESEETRSLMMSSLSAGDLAEHLKFALKRLYAVVGHEPFREPVDTNIFSDYLEYVFNPMDLQTLEQKRSSLQYGSTQAFLSDVEWILHNCIIYNGPTNKLSTIARQIVKSADFEMTEIEVCPECYLNAGKNRPNWFCEPCRTPHILIWAKLQGFAHWPAKALRIERGLVDARFFGQHDRAWIPQSNCYLYSKELPFPVKNKKKAGTKGGLDNAMAEAQMYIDNVKRVAGKFEYAPLRTPLLQEHISRSTISPNYTGDAANITPSTLESDNDSSKDTDDSKSLASQIKGFTHSNSVLSTLQPPKKKSKVVTTSGAHPKKLARAMKHNPLLGKTIESCTASLVTSMERGIDDLACYDSDSSDETTGSTMDTASVKDASPDKDGKQVDKNGTNNYKDGNSVSSDSDSELVIDLPDDDSEKLSKPHAPINLSKYSSAKTKRKIESQQEGGGGGSKVRMIISSKDAVSGGMKRKLTDDASNPTKIKKIEVDRNKTSASGDKLPKKKMTENMKTTARSDKIAVDKTKKRQENLSPALVKKRNNNNNSATEKPYLKTTAKLLSQKMTGKKAVGDKIKDKPQEPLSKRWQSFTIPKTKSTTNNRTEDSTSKSTSSHVTENSPTNKTTFLQKFNDKFNPIIKQMISEFYDDAVKSSVGDNSRSNTALNQQVQQLHNKLNDQAKKLVHYQNKLERSMWEHNNAIADLQHNHDLRVAEMRQSFENDKKQQLEDLRRKLEGEKNKAVEKAKQKQWCANCGKESILYCCWNTTYCDYPCQQEHWSKHMESCTQRESEVDVSSKDEVVDEEALTTSDPLQVVDDDDDDDDDEDAMVIDEAATMPCITTTRYLPTSMESQPLDAPSTTTSMTPKSILSKKSSFDVKTESFTPSNKPLNSILKKTNDDFQKKSLTDLPIFDSSVTRNSPYSPVLPSTTSTSSSSVSHPLKARMLTDTERPAFPYPHGSPGVSSLYKKPIDNDSSMKTSFIDHLIDNSVTCTTSVKSSSSFDSLSSFIQTKTSISDKPTPPHIPPSTSSTVINKTDEVVSTSVDVFQPVDTKPVDAFSSLPSSTSFSNTYSPFNLTEIERLGIKQERDVNLSRVYEPISNSKDKSSLPSTSCR